MFIAIFYWKKFTWISQYIHYASNMRDAIWWHRSGSALVQVMSIRQQCWTNIDLSIRFRDIHLREISQEIAQPSVTNISLKISFKSPRGQRVKHNVTAWASPNFYHLKCYETSPDFNGCVEWCHLANKMQYEVNDGQRNSKKVRLYFEIWNKIGNHFENIKCDLGLSFSVTFTWPTNMQTQLNGSFCSFITILCSNTSYRRSISAIRY